MTQKDKMEVVEDNKLYQLTGAMKELEFLDQDEDIQECLVKINADITTKATGTLKFIQNTDLILNGVDNEIKRLQAFKKSIKTKKDGCLKYVKWVMEKDDIKKLETPIGNFSFRKSESIKIIDDKLIPEEFMKEKTTVTPDKIAIKKALNNGETIQGAVVEYNNNLQIK